MPFQMRFRMLSALLLSLIVPAGSASADMCFNFENCYKQFQRNDIKILYKFSFPLKFHSFNGTIASKTHARWLSTTIDDILAGESKNIEFKERLPEKSIKYKEGASRSTVYVINHDPV